MNREDETLTWRIPVTWEVCGVVNVLANTLKEAMKIAKDDDGVLPLPEGDYVDSSWKLSFNDEETIRKFFNDKQKDRTFCNEK